MTMGCFSLARIACTAAPVIEGLGSHTMHTLLCITASIYAMSWLLQAEQ